MKLSRLTVWILLVSLVLAVSSLADVDILIVGSTRSFSDGNESGVVQEQAFDPTQIAARLQSILSNDPAISETVNVVFEDIYRNKTLDTAIGGGGSIWVYNYRCYSLMQYYMWPEGKANRLANLRGEDTAWDYVVLMGDPYLMANMPGVFAEGVKLLADEISSGTAEPILLAQWPENSSSFSAADFNEIVHRIGDSAEIRVVPAGKAWDSLSSQDSSTSHPTPKGAYLAASAIYSKLYNKSAKTSSYVYNNAVADHAHSVVQANEGVAQYTGTYTDENPFQMKYDQERTVDFNEYGTSTEEGFYNGLVDVFAACRVNFSRRNPPSSGNPVDFSYSRGSDIFEPDKQYRVDPAMYERTYGFPMGDHRNTGATTMIYGIDKRYGDGSWFGNGTDLGVAYSMIRENEVPSATYDVRGIPVRLIWAKMNHYRPELPSHSDGWHLSRELDRGVGAFMYTLVSGRCPVGPEPADDSSTEWKYWFCRKLGYETAWQMSHLTTRVPGFQVLPSAASATDVTPSSSETLTVRFAYAPTSDVTVAVSTDDGLVGRASPSLLTFTPQNYSNAQAVSVMGVTGSAGSHSFSVSLTTSSDDDIYDGLSDSWDYTNTREEGPAPSDIRMVGNGVTILPGDVTPDSTDGSDFGVVTSSVLRTFTVENISASTTINLTGSPRVSISGGSGYFAITDNISVSSLAPGASATFEVTYTPASGGAHTATVTVESTDAAAPAYTFTVGGQKPSQPTVGFDGVSAYGATSATLAGELSAGGFANAWLCWGETDAGTGSTGDWDHVVSIGPVYQGSPFSADAEGLLYGIVYECRVLVSNVSGYDWSGVASFALSNIGTVESLNLDFETGDLQGWVNVGTTAGSDTLFRDGNEPVSGTRISGKQGTYYIDGYESNAGRSDGWTGVIETEDTFILGAGAHLTMISGGGTFTWSGTPDSPGTLAGVALEREIAPDTWESVIFQSGGNNSLTARDHDLSAYEGDTVRLRIYDTTTGSWGWTAVDDISLTAVFAGVSAAISNAVVQNVTNSAADISGVLDSQNALFDIYLYWSQVNNASPAAWEGDGSAQSILVGAYTNVNDQAINKQLSSLLEGTTYYCTFMGANEVTNIWAADNLQFTTLGSGVTYALTYQAGSHGSISGVATQTVSEGGSGSAVTAVPDVGYTFAEWSDSRTVNPRTDTGITSNFTVTADFALDPTVVVNQGAISSNATSAVLSGELTGGGSATAWICWGDNDAGTSSTSDWDHVRSVGGVTVATPFSVLIDSLAANSTYWYRCYVSNGAGSDWSDVAGFSGQPEAGAGGEWTPADIDPEMWFDASDAMSLLEGSDDAVEDGDTVYQWTDKSAHGRDVSQGNATVRPVYDATGWSGGRPQLEFDTYNGATRAHALGRNVTSDGMPVSGYTIFVAINPRSIDSEAWLTTARTTDGKEHRFQINNSGVRASSDAANGGSATAPYTTGEQILQLTLDSTGSEIRRNGQQVAGNNGTFVNKSLTGDFTVSGRSSGDGHAGLDADIAEYILVSGVPDETTRQMIEGYLAHKWGLAASLAGDHPFRSQAPGGSGAIVNAEPTDITGSGATLNASLDASGTNYDVYVYWGTSDGVSNTSSWASSAYVGSCSDIETNVSHTISGLFRGQTYYYTFRANNGAGEVWASPSWQFATPAGCLVTSNHLVSHTWFDSVTTNVISNYEVEVMDDPDGDGFSTWQEYWSGTDPNDANSFLQIDSVSYDGNRVQLEWQHSDVDAGIPSIAIEATTNLLTGLWFLVDTKAPVNGANVWSTTAPRQLFYRLTVNSVP